MNFDTESLAPTSRLPKLLYDVTSCSKIGTFVRTIPVAGGRRQDSVGINLTSSDAARLALSKVDHMPEVFRSDPAHI
jgi:hypothetical protein